jgi:hypothetical protein
MPTIIQYTKTGDHYILLGAGYGQWATARANRLLGDLIPTDQQGDLHLLCICDSAGKVFWANPEDTVVVSVGNQSPAHALRAFE